MSGLEAVRLLLLVGGIATLIGSMVTAAFIRTRDGQRDAATLAVLAVGFGVLALAIPS